MSVGGLLTADTCNTARKNYRLFCVEVNKAAVTKLQTTLGVDEVLDEKKPLVLRQDYHHHLQNILIRAVNKNYQST